MKHYLLGAALLVVAFYMLNHLCVPQFDHSSHPVVSYYPKHFEQAINVCTVQDVSGSVKENGVVLITPNVFAPFYHAWDKPVQLSFVMASSMSAQPPITVELPPMNIAQPMPFDMDAVPYEYRNEAKLRYLEAQKKYRKDSSNFMANREALFDTFCTRVLSALSLYQAKLSSRTDLITAITTADKQLQHWYVPNTANYIVANTDGLDTYHRTIRKLASRAEVLLVNAQRPMKTSIDGIITGNFVSVEQAFSYIIHINKN